MRHDFSWRVEINTLVVTGHLSAFTAKMEKEGLPKVVIDTFAHYYRQVVSGETGLISDRDILPVNPEDVKDAERLDRYASSGSRVLDKTVMIILNGGLGTSMGLTGPKSLLRIKDGKSFLEISLAQAEKIHVRLALMNSFRTHADTTAAILKIAPATKPTVFLQHKFPKIFRDGLAPAVWPQNPELEWNPPGHGDIYTALYTSGMLQKFLDDGIRYAFISNADNLGATLDESLLGYFAETDFPFMMEVAERTPAGLKGGHLARHRSGRLLLREIAQCPAEEIEAFQDIRHYRFFNTNNLWVNLEYLRALFADHDIVRLPMILNPKTLDPRDPQSPPVYQIETAMGAAISLFEGASAIKIPNSRFYPVKKCNDLLAVRSDCFILADDHRLIVNPERTLDRIKINLDPTYYGRIDMFDERFAAGIPSLVHCESLSIEGDVFFEGDVTITGRVKIKNRGPEKAVIKKGAVIDKDIIL